MKLGRMLRLVGVVLVLLALALLVTLTLRLTDSALDLVERLRDESLAVQIGAGAALLAVVVFSGWVVWRLLRPARPTATSSPPVLNEDALNARLDEAAADGVDVSAARAELARRDASTRTLDVAVFGEISAGKSSLIKALLPGADVVVSPIGGSTATVNAYHWRSPAETDVRLLDLPGVSGIDTDDTPLVDEARRAHVVLFVCDTDLTRADLDTVDVLARAGKPMIVALNKADQYAADELAAILGRIHERVLGLETDGPVTVIPAIAGGAEQVITRAADGSETPATRERSADIAKLVAALNHLVTRAAPELIQRRDQALFQLAGDKLRAAELEYQRHRGEEVVRSHTRKAVIGALAAVSPGTDIVIQGYLGSSMVRELCKLNDVAVGDIEIDKFLDLSQSRVGSALPLTLAVAGNGLKAFPGIGTISGGVVHAIAYGLIFDALGRSLIVSLAERQAFETEAVAEQFSAELAGRLEHRVARIARLALAELGNSKKDA